VVFRLLACQGLSFDEQFYYGRFLELTDGRHW